MTPTPTEGAERRTKMEWAMEVSRARWESDTEAEEKLQAKCRWEHMSRTAVILEWGDPRTWP